MRALAALAGAVVIVLTLVEFFVAFLLPRRVKHEPRVARMILVAGWRVWRFCARRLPARSSDTMLGFYGPVLMLFAIALWAARPDPRLRPAAVGRRIARDEWRQRAGFDDDLFFSAGGFLSASTQLSPQTALARGLFLGEATCGFGVLFVAIGYLPAIYQAFSRREVAVAQLAPRAGTPPTAGALMARSRPAWTGRSRRASEWDGLGGETQSRARRSP